MIPADAPVARSKWSHLEAEMLWTLRDSPRLRDRFFARLDGMVGMTGRGLLLPRDHTA
jgi:hypothetical protein